MCVHQHAPVPQHRCKNLESFLAFHLVEAGSLFLRLGACLVQAGWPMRVSGMEMVVVMSGLCS